jgi:hypothetical protein
MKLALLSAAMLSGACSAAMAEPVKIAVEFAAAQGAIRPLHGINKGPLSANGLFNVTEAHRQLRTPWTRLHDCHHPNPDVVDIHAVFPDMSADPVKPESYDFRATDEYIDAIVAAGSGIVYRLGESIEHQKVKRHVHPPRDPAKWAEVCAGIVRHCNNGWAGGRKLGIRYWEIWNEPENRPVMWTGDDAQFLELYRLTAQRLRQEFPDIKIGGPGFGHCGKFDGKELTPSPLCAALLDQCRNGALPLDFFSWHCYTDNPAELPQRAFAIRRMLDARGFGKTESHLNEWNFLPQNSWELLSRDAPAQTRQRAVEQMAGAAGGAFLTAALMELQDAPVDVCNFYHGENGIFGLFTEVGAPVTAYHAMLAFSKMLDTPRRCQVAGTIPGKLTALAGIDADNSRAAVLVANAGGKAEVEISLSHIPWPGKTLMKAHWVDDAHALAEIPPPSFDGARMVLKFDGPAVAWIVLRPEKAGP